MEVSDKYQNKQDIKYSLTKIMPATISNLNQDLEDGGDAGAGQEGHHGQVDPRKWFKLPLVPVWW